MEVRGFLERLLRYGTEKKFFEVDTIKSLDKSCCKSCDVEAINFDKTKDIVCSAMKLRPYKSVDALKIVVDAGRIDFIEMKGLNDFIFPKFADRNNFDKNKDVSKQIEDKVASFDVVSKIEDSISLLRLIIDSQNFTLTNKEKTIFKSLPKNFFVVTDIEPEQNPLEYIVATLDLLSETSSSIERMCLDIFSDQIKDTTYPNIYNIQQPLAMTCSGLSKFYS